MNVIHTISMEHVGERRQKGDVFLRSMIGEVGRTDLIFFSFPGGFGWVREDTQLMKMDYFP